MQGFVGGGGNSLRPYSQQRPMRTNLSCCLGLIDNGQYKRTNRLLVVVPHKRPHGIMRILKNLCMLLPKALKMRAIKDTMALVADSIVGGSSAVLLPNVQDFACAILPRRLLRFATVLLFASMAKCANPFWKLGPCRLELCDRCALHVSGEVTRKRLKKEHERQLESCHCSKLEPSWVQCSPNHKKLMFKRQCPKGVSNTRMVKL